MHADSSPSLDEAPGGPLPASCQEQIPPRCHAKAEGGFSSLCLRDYPKQLSGWLQLSWAHAAAELFPQPLRVSKAQQISHAGNKCPKYQGKGGGYARNTGLWQLSKPPLCAQARQRQRWKSWCL